MRKLLRKLWNPTEILEYFEAPEEIPREQISTAVLHTVRSSKFEQQVETLVERMDPIYRGDHIILCCRVDLTEDSDVD